MEYTDEELLSELQSLMIQLYSPNDDQKFRENLNRFLVNLVSSKVNIEDSGGTAPKVFHFAVTNDEDVITSGTNKYSIRIPFGMTVTEVRAELSTPQTSGSIFTIDINESGNTILGTKLTIANGSGTSVGGTPATITDAVIADNAVISVDIDQSGDGTAKGLRIALIGN